MNNKGFAKNLVSFVIVLIAAGVLAYLIAVKRPQTTVPADTETPFTLVEKRTYGPNASLYKGMVMVEGEYSVDYSDNIVGGGTLYFAVDEQYRSKLPKKYGEYSQSFIFDNELSAKQMLGIYDGDKSVCSLSGRAKIVIEDYTAELLESSGIFDHTMLTKVLDKSIPTAAKCEETKSVGQNSEIKEGRACGGGVMAGGGACRVGYTCRFSVNHSPGADDGVCEKN